MSIPFDVYLHMLQGEDTGSKFYLRPPGLPSNVAAGCVPKAVVIDRGQPATRRDGSQILRRTKQGKNVLAIDYRAVPNAVYQDRLNRLKRMGAGRYTGPFPTRGKKARLAAEAR